MINTTATTLGVKGNGKTLGLVTIDPDAHFGIANVANYGWIPMNVKGNFDNAYVGATMASRGYTNAIGNSQIGGVTTDFARSGIVANMPATIAPTKWVIKY